MKSRALKVSAAIAAGASAVAWRAYRKDITEARRRVVLDRQVIDSPDGPIEFAESGNGPAVLLIHGAGGGFDQGLDLGRAFLGDAYRVIAPSRFGYLGTPVPADASPEAQAEAYLRLLDALQLERVAVIAVSAGAPSAMQLCLKHPERCSALALIVPMAFAPQREPAGGRSKIFTGMLNMIATSDLLFWSAMKVAHSTLVETLLGTPIEIYRNATRDQRRSIDQLLGSILPISKRAAGISNDGIVSANLKRYPLEEIQVPTLVMSVADDLYGTYDSALYTAAHIPHGKFVGYSSGGHLLMGLGEEVRSQITMFLAEHRSVEVKTA